MSDLEMTKACARAMGIELCRSPDCEKFPMLHGDFHDHYDPLHNDAQVMALVKKLKLNIGQLSGGTVQVFTAFDAGHIYQSDGKDLNRAIVECVAMMRRNHE